MLRPYQVTLGGVQPQYVPAANEQMSLSASCLAFMEACDYVPADAVLHVKNNGNQVVVVSVPYAVPCNQGVYHELNVAVAPLEDAFIGPFVPKERYERDEYGGASKAVKVAYSGIQGLEVAALNLK